MTGFIQRSESPVGNRAFPTTQWSLIVTAGGNNGPEVRVALEELCQIYWYPLYTFIRSRGYDSHHAEDVTQDFFFHLLKPGYVQQADPQRGRFRSFLLASLNNFLSNERERRNAQKRGGGVVTISLDTVEEIERFQVQPPASGLTPEEVYDRNWALSIIARVLKALEIEYIAAGRGPLFALLRNVVWGDAEVSHDAIAAELGMSAGAIKVSIHRLRKRLQGKLREAVAQTVAQSQDTEDELRILLAALRPPRPNAL